MGAPVPHVESASAPTQAYPAEDQRQASPPDIATPDKWPDSDAPWPWYRRTAVVIPIAVVLIVAAVATILFVISGEEEPAPGGQAGGGGGAGGSGGSGLDGTYAFEFGAPTQPNGQPFDERAGRRRDMGDQIGVPHQGLRGERDEVQRIHKYGNDIGAGRGRRTMGVGQREAGNVPGRRRRGRSLGVAVTGVTAGRVASRRVHRSLDRPQLCQQPPGDATRIGDADSDVSVADPAAMPARVVSPGQALYGSYQETDTYKDGNRNADVSFDIQSFCLRTGERCLSYWLSPNDIKVLIFAKNEWVLANRSSDSKCTNGGPAHREITLQYPLPSPAQDPITLLTGRGHYTVTGGCPFNSDFDSKVQRTGD